MQKRKLLVVAGAGASIDLGMPGLEGVGDLLSAYAQEQYPLFEDGTKNLYQYIQQTIASDWRGKVPRSHRKPTFEDVLYAIFALASAFPAGQFTSGLGAFIAVRALPDINWLGSRREEVGPDTLRRFGNSLVDYLLDSFRNRCRDISAIKSRELAKFRAFFSALHEKFELSIVTLNYDDLIYRAIPGIETGFDRDGRFVDSRIIQRISWPCILHLHGSVHFDMREDFTGFAGFGGLHEVHWTEDLGAQYSQNADGRNPFRTIEGVEFPTSSIVAGYGKTTQILRRPFRTYFGELDRLVIGCDAVLFLGYGFSDVHLNLAFENFRDARRRPVVVIDFAPDNAITASGIDWSGGHQTIKSVLGLLQTKKHTMTWLGYSFPSAVGKLKAAKEFEISNDPGYPLAIWYGGMLAACDSVDKVIERFWIR